MIKYAICPESSIIAISDAIKEKRGLQNNETLTIAQMPVAIQEIETGNSIEDIILEFNETLVDSENIKNSGGWTSDYPNVYSIENSNIDIVKKAIEYFSAGYNVYIKILHSYSTDFSLINIFDTFNYPNGHEFKSSSGQYSTITGQGVIGMLVNQQSDTIYDSFRPYIFVEGTFVWHGGS